MAKIMAEDGKILMTKWAGYWYRQLATDCGCRPTDVLVLTCNANRITDDDYTVKVNGHMVGNVVHIGNSTTGCGSPGNGIWACTDPSITPDDLAAQLWNEQPCVEDNAWTPGTLDPAWLLDTNTLELTATSDEGCGDWGVVSVYSVDAPNKRICEMIGGGAYTGLSGPPPVSMFSGNFDWNPLP